MQVEVSKRSRSPPECPTHKRARNLQMSFNPSRPPQVYISTPNCNIISRIILLEYSVSLGPLRVLKSTLDNASMTYECVHLDQNDTCSRYIEDSVAFYARLGVIAILYLGEKTYVGRSGSFLIERYFILSATPSSDGKKSHILRGKNSEFDLIMINSVAWFKVP